MTHKQFKGPLGRNLEGNLEGVYNTFHIYFLCVFTVPLE
jgi:hypothetical protein